MSISRCYNLSDFRRIAKRRLPAPIFNYMDGGADDEWSLKANTSAFDYYELMPRYLRDVSKIDMRTRVLGADIDWPVFLAPTGMSRLFNHVKEPGVARAAARAGTLYSLSTLSTTNIEDVAAATTGPKMFQIYIFKDRGLTEEFIQRCKAAKYTALCLTVDTLVAGNRERDHRFGMTMPPKFGLKSLLSFAMHPEWTLRALLEPQMRMVNVVHKVDAIGGGNMPIMEYINSQFDRSLNWKDVEWLAKQWGGPLAIKGLQAPEDAVRARDAGATAVMISNHGGRQLDASPACVDCVAPMRDAVGDGMQLIVDGGVRRGTHVLKALALGANACSIGRGYLYALAAGGEAGVDRALKLLRAEVERGMALLGCASVAQIDRKAVISRR